MLLRAGPENIRPRLASENMYPRIGNLVRKCYRRDDGRDKNSLQCSQ